MNKIESKINDACYNEKDWESLVEQFNNDEVEYMRKYYLNSEIPFKNESIDNKENIIFLFMKLLVSEYLIYEGNIGRANNILSYLNGN